MADFLGAEGTFLVQYGDVLTNEDFRAMLRFHREHGGLATLLVHRRQSGMMSALEVDDQGRVLRFLERPTEEERRSVASPWVFSGVALCEPALLERIPTAGASDLPRDVFAPLAAAGLLSAYPLTARRCAVDSPERLAEAEVEAREGWYSSCTGEGEKESWRCGNAPSVRLDLR
jgi:NDP-sugar pyrophosphorylase family protein